MLSPSLVTLSRFAPFRIALSPSQSVILSVAKDLLFQVENK